MIFSVTATIIPVEVNPAQLAYVNQINNFTMPNYYMDLVYFYGGLVVGYTTDTVNGTLRYNNGQLQLYNGSWNALGGGSADTTCEDASCDLSDDTGYMYTNLDFTGTTGFDDFVDNDTTYTHLSNFTDDLNQSINCSNIYGGDDSDFCSDANDGGVGGADGLGEWMYLNIENSFSDPVRWNITQESSDTYTFVIKAGRHWIVTGGEI